MTKADVLGFCQRYARNRAALVALGVLVAIVAVAIAGPHLLRQGGPFELAGPPFQPPFGRFALGSSKSRSVGTEPLWRYGARSQMPSRGLFA